MENIAAAKTTTAYATNATGPYAVTHRSHAGHIMEMRFPTAMDRALYCIAEGLRSRNILTYTDAEGDAPRQGVFDI